MSKVTKENVIECLKKLDSLILEFLEVSEKIKGGDLDDVVRFNEKYSIIDKKLNEASKMLIDYDKSRTDALWDELDQKFDDFNYIYDASSVGINNIIVNSSKEIQESNKKSKGIDLAVYSIILSILAFVLTNAKILAASQIDFKNVLLVNLSFILSAVVLFTFIYVFLGVHSYGRNRKLKLFTLLVSPIVLVAAIVLVAIFM